MDDEETKRGSSHNEILFRLKKQGNSNTCYNLDEHQEHYVKQIKPVIKGQILGDSTYMRALE